VAKRLLMWAVVGAGLGDLVGVLLGGKVISYWFRPPGVTDQDRCVVQIEAALGDIAKFQGITATIGLVICVIAGIAWSRRRSPAQPPEGAVK
jgi:hypothetical protein